MRHILERPVWSALGGVHAHLALGDDRARRYDPAVSPFAATCDDEPESLASLAGIAQTRGTLVFLQADPVRLPAMLAAARTADAVQMVSEVATDPPADPRIERLGVADIPAMLELASLTSPGPITARALDLGSFWGIRSRGRLTAMAGQRLRQPGYVEVSGVCTHPDARGQGLARLLSLHVAARIREEGATPYLHAYATNTVAIGLYEAIGFRVRSTMYAAVVEVGA